VKVRRERKETPLIVYILFLAFPLFAKHREFLATVKPVPYCRKSTTLLPCSYSSKSNIPCSHLRINFCCSRGLGLGAEEHTIIGMNRELLFSERKRENVIEMFGIHCPTVVLDLHRNHCDPIELLGNAGDASRRRVSPVHCTYPVSHFLYMHRFRPSDLHFHQRYR
jgi:hypothetical protein